MAVESCYRKNSISLLTAIFTGRAGLAGTTPDIIGAKDDGTGGDSKSYKTCEFQSKHHHQQTNTQLFTGWMPFMSPNQQWQSTEGIEITIGQTQKWE